MDIPTWSAETSTNIDDGNGFPKNQNLRLSSGSYVYGWGMNWDQQLGTQIVNDGSNIVWSPTILQLPELPFDGVYQQVVFGRSHSVILNNNYLKPVTGQENDRTCFIVTGDGSKGQLMNGLLTPQVYPSQIRVKVHVVDTSSPNPNRRTTRRQSATSTVHYTVPAGGHPDGTAVRDVAAGDFHTCILAYIRSAEGYTSTDVPRPRYKPYCSGQNSQGQIGNPDLVNNFVPYPVPVDLSQVVSDPSDIQSLDFYSIASGPDHVAAVTSDGLLVTWGANSKGELGNGGTTNAPRPTAVYVQGVAFIEVQCGYRFCIARTKALELYGWGVNDKNQLGGATTLQTVTTPTLIPGISGVTMYAVGDSHVLAISGGRLYSWGDGTSGQTAQPKSIPANMLSAWTIAVPTPLPFFDSMVIQSIAAGSRHSLVLDTCGNIYGFGSNIFGQLGVSKSRVGASTNYNTQVPLLIFNQTAYDSAIPLPPGSVQRDRRLLKVFAGPYSSAASGVQLEKL